MSRDEVMLGAGLRLAVDLGACAVISFVDEVARDPPVPVFSAANVGPAATAPETAGELRAILLDRLGTGGINSRASRWKSSTPATPNATVAAIATASTSSGARLKMNSSRF